MVDILVSSHFETLAVQITIKNKDSLYYFYLKTYHMMLRMFLNWQLRAFLSHCIFNQLAVC